MTIQELRKLPAWRKLDAGAEKMALPEYHLRNLTAQKNRLQRFSVSGGGIFYDYSRQRVDEQVMEYLFELAESRGLLEKFREMTNGAHVNETEDRAALHTAARQFSDTPVLDNGRDVMPELREVREQIKKFADAVHRGEIRGSTGQPFQ